MCPGRITQRLGAAGWAGKRGVRFESSEALAEQPAVARTAVELHGCCARVSLAEALLSQHIDGVARAGSAGTKSGSSARSLVLLTMLAPVVENRTVEGPATARRRSELGNRRPLYGGQLSSPPYSGRRFANIQRQRGPAGPSISVFCADGPRRDRLTCTLHWRLSASRSIANLRTSCRGGWLLFGCPGRQIPTGGLQLAHRFGHWL